MHRGNRLKRHLDHLLGLPILLLMGFFRRTRPAPDRILRVGILSCSAIGDTIIASAIARDLKASNPGCFVIVFIPPFVRGISKLVEGFDEEVIVSITRPMEAVKIVRQHPTDVLIDIMPWPRMSAILTALSKARFTVGFRTAGQHRHFAYDVVAHHRADQHEIENLRDLLAPLGIAGRRLPRARSALQGLAFSTDTERSDIIIHPWASGFRCTMREWPLERWVELAQHLIDTGATISITGGPSDCDRAQILAAMINRPGRITVLAGTATLYETAIQIARASLVICVNTGTMHLAAALGQKLVALHGPTNPERWGPLSERAIVVGPNQFQGGAYLNMGFEYPAGVSECMSLITTDDVLQCARYAMRPISASRENPAFDVVPGPVNSTQFGLRLLTGAGSRNLTPHRPALRHAATAQDAVKRAQDLVGATLITSVRPDPALHQD